MQSVIETPTFLADAEHAGLSEEDRIEIINLIAGNPTAGVLMPGTGGARKLRVAGRGKGKSGGYRIISYFAAADVPTLLLAVVSKGDRADLSKAEQNALRTRLSRFAEAYRDGVQRRLADMRNVR